MRLVLIAAIVFASVAGASVAQDSPPPAFVYRWERQPAAHDFARRYPNSAHDVSGAAVMCCSVKEDRTLDCTVPFEWPQGSGFAAATLSLSREFRLSEASYAEVQGTERARIRRMIRWVMAPGSPELDAAFARISSQTQAICQEAEAASAS
jgi:hypothetical protein